MHIILISLFSLNLSFLQHITETHIYFHSLFKAGAIHILKNECINLCCALDESYMTHPESSVE